MNNRRKFLQQLGGSVAAMSVAGLPSTPAVAKRQLSGIKPVTANDKIRIGLIGSGIIGHYDTDTALKVPGVELVAVCDLYEGRRIRAKEKWGTAVFTTADYREVLNRKDIDAVLVCTPDHWHDRISIDAMNAGKHVYCEKPMVHHIDEGAAVIATQQKTGKVFQVGSQRASSAAILKAKEYFEQGAIGELTVAESYVDRSDAIGAWNYSIPTDASPQTVDWDKFVGDAPKRPFDATRFFRWRNFKEYGTGVAGDLFVHNFTALHTIVSSLGPNKIYALGGLTYWKDGRDAYDLVNGVMQYPKTAQHPAFQFVTRVNLASGAGSSWQTRLIGTEGMIDIGWNDFSLKRFKRPLAANYGGYDSFESFSAEQKVAFEKDYKARYTEEMRKWKYEPDVKFDPPPGYDDRLDHMTVFFNAIRGQGTVKEDAAFGLRAAAPSLAANLSVELQRPILWDPVKMKMLS